MTLPGIHTSTYRFLPLLLVYLITSQTVVAQNFSFDFQRDTSTFPGYVVTYAIQNNPSESICNRDGFDQCSVMLNSDYFGCHSPGFGCPAASSAPVEDTPMVYEVISVSATERYLHMIIGDPASGFAQDVYIRGSTSGNNNATQSTWAAEFNDGKNNLPGAGTGPLQGGGNGTANPDKVVIRQVMGGTWDDTAKTWACEGSEFCSEYLKDTLTRKPKITQKVTTAELEAVFIADMSSIDYRTANATLTVTGSDPQMINTVTITDPGFFYGNEGNFDMSTQQGYTKNTDKLVQNQVIDVTAGKFTYTESANTDIFGAGGTYTYFADAYDPTTVNWCEFYDETQNIAERGVCK